MAPQTVQVHVRRHHAGGSLTARWRHEDWLNRVGSRLTSPGGRLPTTNRSGVATQQCPQGLHRRATPARAHRS